MMNKEKNRNLLKQLNVVAIDMSNKFAMCNNSLNQAITINEELINIGYTLKPQDIIKLSELSVETMDKVFNIIYLSVDIVRAKPMYPNFPLQVMEMDEAELRMHQLIHYFSTYGVEMLFGEKVSKGWLPSVEDTEKTESDLTLLKPTVIELIDEADVDNYIIDRCFSKRERLTLPELALVKDAIKNVSVAKLSNADIKFKENLPIVFDVLFHNGDKDINHYKFCKHTGDILRCLEYELDACNMHFTTSRKKFFVKLLESYPAYDFASNIILSRSRAELNKVLLRHISYNTFSRSADHLEVVRQLRNNELTSWEGKVKKLIFSKNSEAAMMAAERPGMLLRYITLLYRNGISPFEIEQQLASVADKLSTQTLVTLLNYFERDTNEITLYNGEPRDNAEIHFMRIILKNALLKNLSSKNIPELEGKKVYIDDGGFDFAHSKIETNIKSIEGGYIPSGIAYKIPDDVKFVRFFIYWNHRDRVDIDLHASLCDCNDYKSNIGWNSNFKLDYATHSGDITHSDAAEYIDISLDPKYGLKYATTVIDLYSGAGDFSMVDECYVGMMAVNKIGETVKLYDAKNCFYTHNLRGEYSRINYGYIDIKNRCLIFVGQGQGTKIKYNTTSFSVQTYLDMLTIAKSAKLVNNKEEADVILCLGKSSDKKAISLIDVNYWMD